MCVSDAWASRATAKTIEHHNRRTLLHSNDAAFIIDTRVLFFEYILVQLFFLDRFIEGMEKVYYENRDEFGYKDVELVIE